MLIISFITMIFYGFCALLVSGYENSWIIISAYSFILSTLLLAYCVEEAVSGVICARTMVIAGFSVFCFADIGKYFAFERLGRFVDISTATEVAFLIAAGFFIFMLFPRQIRNNNLRADKHKLLYNCNYFGKRVSVVVLLAVVVSILYYTSPAYYKHSYLSIINYFSKAVIIYMVYLYVCSKRKLFLCICLFLSMLVMVDTSRRAFLAVIIPVSIIITENTLIKYDKIKRTVIMTCGIVVIFIFLNFMRAGHDFGHGYKQSDYFANTINYITSFRSIDTFYNTCYVYENVPYKYPYYYGETYLSVLFGLIPRSLWPEKPVGFAAPLALMQKAGVRNFDIDKWYEINQFSLSPGYFGEAMANFGVVGAILASVVLGYACLLYDRGTNAFRGIRVNRVQKLCILPVFFLLMRGDFYSAVIYVFFITTFIYIIDKTVAAN